MKTYNDLVKDIERDVIINLTISVRRKRISLDEAKIISKDLMDNYPIRSYEDLFKKLYFLSLKHRIIRKIYVNYAPVYFNAKSLFVLKKMRESIQNNDIKSALNLAKGVKYG